MKQRRIAIALVFFLCAAALLSGTLLVLHTDHECHQETCTLCMILARNTETFLCLLIAFAGMGLLGGQGKHCLDAPRGNRFIPDWTLVCRKVKLQD